MSDEPPTRVRPARAAIILAVAIGLLYFASINTHWLPSTDSALYLTIGRNLARGDGYTYQGQSAVATEPLVPLLLAFC